MIGEYFRNHDAAHFNAIICLDVQVIHNLRSLSRTGMVYIIGYFNTAFGSGILQNATYNPFVPSIFMVNSKRVCVMCMCLIIVFQFSGQK